MKTGPRFWQLLGLVGLVLFGYVLAELHDAVQAKQTELDSAHLLLSKQEALLSDSRWTERQRTIQKIRRQWEAYLPVEDSPALAKAHLLTTMRHAATDAGVIGGLSVSALDAEGSEQDSAVKTGASNMRPPAKGKGAKGNALPAGVQMTKVRISGRFEPTSFMTLLRALERDGRFVRLESVTVHGTQLEIGLRAYWRIKVAAISAPAAVPTGAAVPNIRS